MNTTISGNSGPTGCSASSYLYPYGRDSAGIGVFASTLTLDHVTLADNANGPTISAEHLTTYRSAATSTTNLCSGFPQTVSNPSPPPLIIDASGDNWFTDTTCGLAGPGDMQTSGNFLLAPLADNGGLVPTRLPASGSVLIDRISPASCPVKEDARSVTRPQGNACDVGAVEVASR